jgi:hypothetical protein
MIYQIVDLIAVEAHCDLSATRASIVKFIYIAVLLASDNLP